MAVSGKEECMEFDKSTILAGMVWVAGVLATVLFQNVFASSQTGVILGILLAVVILIATYFILDGIRTMLLRRHEEEMLHQKAYEDKMLEIMQHEMGELVDCEKTALEQVEKLVEREKANSERIAKLAETEKATSKSIEQILQSEKLATESMEKLTETVQAAETAQAEQVAKIAAAQAERAEKEAAQPQAKQQETKAAELNTEALNQLAETINKTTMQAAKIIVKYSNKSSHEIEGKIDSLSQEISQMSREDE